MLDRNELQEFLNSKVTPETFPVFAAISNLNNLDNQRELLNLLARNRINLTDLQSMRIVDDIAVADFLKTYNKFSLPFFNSGTVPSQNAYNYLLGERTPLVVFLEEYNAYINDNFGKEQDTYNVNTLQLDFSKSIYVDDSDFELDFQKKVVTPICIEQGISDISEVILPFIPSIELGESELTLVMRIHDRYIKDFMEHANNDKLSQLFVWNNERPSIVMTKLAELNEIANLRTLSPIIDQQLHSDIFNLSTRDSLEFERLELDLKWEELYSTDLGKQSLTNSFAYIRYRIAFLNTLEQKNNGTINSNLEKVILELFEYLTGYMEFHNTIEGIISSRLNVKTL